MDIERDFCIASKSVCNVEGVRVSSVLWKVEIEKGKVGEAKLI